MIKELYDVYYDDLMTPKSKTTGIWRYKEKMTPAYQKNAPELIVCDYLSAMTDSYVLSEYERIFLPIVHDEMI